MEICLETAFGDMRSAELMLVQGFPRYYARKLSERVAIAAI